MILQSVDNFIKPSQAHIAKYYVHVMGETSKDIHGNFGLIL